MFLTTDLGSIWLTKDVEPNLADFHDLQPWRLNYFPPSWTDVADLHQGHQGLILCYADHVRAGDYPHMADLTGQGLL